MSRELFFAGVTELPPGMTTPAEALAGLWARTPVLAEAVEDALDWIERDPPDPRCRRRRFDDGTWAVNVEAAGEAWVLLWREDEPDRPRLLLLAESTSI